MEGFEKLHPVVNFVFITFVVVLSSFIINPVYSSLSFICAAAYIIYTEKRAGVKTVFCFTLPLIIFVAVFNFAFSHLGDTVLFSAFDTSLTLEALLYGFNQGLVFSALSLWLFIYGRLVSGDRFITMFSKLFPHLAVLISISLGFFARFRKQNREIKEARAALLGKENNSFKESLSQFSALISITVESSIKTADSMRSKGYDGNIKSYNQYRFSVFDLFITAIITVFSFYIIIAYSLGTTVFYFEPIMEYERFDVLSAILFLLLCALPLIYDFKEVAKWRYLKWKI